MKRALDICKYLNKRISVTCRLLYDRMTNKGYRTPMCAGVCEPEHGALRAAHRSPDSAGHHRHRLRTLHTPRHTRETLCWHSQDLEPKHESSVADPWHLVRFWIQIHGPGSGSADPYLWLTDPFPASDPAIFVSDLQDCNKNYLFSTFFCLLFLLLLQHLHHFSKIKNHTHYTSHKSDKTVGIYVFLTIFAWSQNDPEPDLDPKPYIWLLDPDPGGPKWYGSATLLETKTGINFWNLTS